MRTMKIIGRSSLSSEFVKKPLTRFRRHPKKPCVLVRSRRLMLKLYCTYRNLMRAMTSITLDLYLYLRAHAHVYIFKWMFFYFFFLY